MSGLHSKAFSAKPYFWLHKIKMVWSQRWLTYERNDGWCILLCFVFLLSASLLASYGVPHITLVGLPYPEVQPNPIHPICPLLAPPCFIDLRWSFQSGQGSQISYDVSNMIVRHSSPQTFITSDIHHPLPKIRHSSPRTFITSDIHHLRRSSPQTFITSDIHHLRRSSPPT